MERIRTIGKPKAALRRSRAVSGALRRERRSSASRAELSRHTRRVARRRGRANLGAASLRAVRTKGPAERRAAARRAAKTRQAAVLDRSEEKVMEALPTVEAKERLS